MNSLTIVPSPELNAIGLKELVGRTGILCENLCGDERKNKGFMVCLDEPYKDERDWFIPWQSIDYVG